MGLLVLLVEVLLQGMLLVLQFTHLLVDLVQLLVQLPLLCLQLLQSCQLLIKILLESSLRVANSASLNELSLLLNNRSLYSG